MKKKSRFKKMTKEFAKVLSDKFEDGTLKDPIYALAHYHDTPESDMVSCNWDTVISIYTTITGKDF